MSMTNKALCAQHYAAGRWSAAMLAAACAKGKITAAEYTEITGQDYTGQPYIPEGRAANIEAQLASQDEAIIALYEARGGAL